MFLKIDLLRVIGSLCLTILLAAAAMADTIRLKDGSIIKGKIVSFAGGKFTVEIGSGSRTRRMSFLAGEIESIQFDSRPEIITASNRSFPAPKESSDDEDVIKKSSPPKVVTTDNLPKKNPAPDNKPAAIPAKTVISSAKPIGLNVKVLADNTANGWTNTGWVVKKGQRIKISGDGEVNLGGGRMSSPSGEADINDDAKLLKNVPTGALIAVIGDDNNDFIYVGAEREFTAARDGALFLGINDGNLNDNSGSFRVKVEISP